MKGIQQASIQGKYGTEGESGSQSDTDRGECRFLLENEASFGGQR